MLITFCGECTSSGSYNNFPIRISVGDEEALPAGSALRYGYPRPYGDDYYQMGCTQYFVPDVASGEHSVKAEWCVTSFYQTAACRDRSLLVQYFK